MSRSTPLTIVAGYLGAGKTTFINRLLSGDHGLRLAVLVNDFGEVNIDAGLIASDDGDTYTLTNGCICCSIGDDLSETLINIARSENPPDEVVIEASGVAEASRFATYSGEWLGFGLRGIVVLADIETIRTKAKDKYVGDLVVNQLRGADLLVLNKIDLVEASVVDDVIAWLAESDVKAPVIATANASVPMEVLFDIERRAEDVVVHSTDADRNHEAMFASTVIRDAGGWTRAGLEDALGSLPPEVVRAKGMVMLPSEESLALVQVVGQRWQITDPPAGSSGQTELVLIAFGDQAAVDAAAKELAGKASAS